MTRDRQTDDTDLKRRRLRLLRGLGLTTRVKETTPKELLMNAVKRLPADTTVEEVLDLAYFLLTIHEQLAEFEAGRLVPEEELKKRFELRYGTS